LSLFKVSILIIPSSFFIARKVFRRSDPKAGSEQKQSRTWRVLEDFGISLEHLKKGVLDPKTFVVGTPAKSLLLSAETEAEREQWFGAFTEAFEGIRSRPPGGGGGGAHLGGWSGSGCGGGGGGAVAVRRMSKLLSSSSSSSDPTGSAAAAAASKPKSRFGSITSALRGK
jgi:hypothetical protein